jgi:hypothetical protein
MSRSFQKKTLCANKKRLRSEHGAMEQHDGFGVGVGSVAKVVDASVRLEATDDGKTSRGAYGIPVALGGDLGRRSWDSPSRSQLYVRRGGWSVVARLDRCLRRWLDHSRLRPRLRTLDHIGLRLWLDRSRPRQKYPDQHGQQPQGNYTDERLHQRNGFVHKTSAASAPLPTLVQVVFGWSHLIRSTTQGVMG